jgi:hypothetical protein
VRALVVDAIAAEGLARLRDRGFAVTELMKPSAEELRAALADCEALVTRSSLAVTAQLLDQAPRLRTRARAAASSW